MNPQLCGQHSKACCCLGCSSVAWWRPCAFLNHPETHYPLGIWENFFYRGYFRKKDSPQPVIYWEIFYLCQYKSQKEISRSFLDDDSVLNRIISQLVKVSRLGFLADRSWSHPSTRILPLVNVSGCLGGRALGQPFFIHPQAGSSSSPRDSGFNLMKPS